jgi:hypothetical protein
MAQLFLDRAQQQGEHGRLGLSAAGVPRDDEALSPLLDVPSGNQAERVALNPRNGDVGRLVLFQRRSEPGFQRPSGAVHLLSAVLGEDGVQRLGQWVAAVESLAILEVDTDRVNKVRSAVRVPRAEPLLHALQHADSFADAGAEPVLAQIHDVLVQFQTAERRPQFRFVSGPEPRVKALYPVQQFGGGDEGFVDAKVDAFGLQVLEPAEDFQVLVVVEGARRVYRRRIVQRSSGNKMNCFGLAGAGANFPVGHMEGPVRPTRV